MLAKASYGKRVLAWFVDNLCIGMISGVTLGIGLALILTDSVTPIGVGLIIISPVAILGFVFWNLVFRQGRTGQTIGKSLMSIKLVSTESGGPVGAGSSFVRGLVAWALNLVTGGLFSLVDLLFPLFDKNGQRVVDKMLKMQVTPVTTPVVTTGFTPPPAPTSAMYG
jgi:uncharacterized RDD family membrane protein YckC